MLRHRAENIDCDARPALLIMITVPVCLVLASLAPAYFALSGMLLFADVLHWHRGTAFILEKRVSNVAQHATTSMPFFLLHCYVRYSYTVNGKLFKGNRANSFSLNGENEYCARVARKAVGDIVPVYYNPMQPEQSMLDNSLNLFALCKLVLVSFMLLALGLVLLNLLHDIPIRRALEIYASICSAVLMCGYWASDFRNRLSSVTLVYFVIAFVVLIAPCTLK